LSGCFMFTNLFTHVVEGGPLGRPSPYARYTEELNVIPKIINGTKAITSPLTLKLFTPYVLKLIAVA
jgi:hypothetical protein